MIFTRAIGGRVRGRGARLHVAILDEPRFDFVTADVGHDLAVDVERRLQRLAAFLDHLLVIDRVVDDVAVFVGEVVFLQYRTHAVAPATRRLHVSYDFWLIHNRVITLHIFYASVLN